MTCRIPVALLIVAAILPLGCTQERTRKASVNRPGVRGQVTDRSPREVVQLFIKYTEAGEYEQAFQLSRFYGGYPRYVLLAWLKVCRKEWKDHHPYIDDRFSDWTPKVRNNNSLIRRQGLTVLVGVRYAKLPPYNGYANPPGLTLVLKRIGGEWKIIGQLPGA